MNTHKHARLTFARRLEMVQQMTLQGLSAVQAAAVQGVTPPTARKWLGRYLAGGEAALADASSRPASSPRAIDPSKALLILEPRKRRMQQRDGRRVPPGRPDRAVRGRASRRVVVEAAERRGVPDGSVSL